MAVRCCLVLAVSALAVGVGGCSRPAQGRAAAGVGDLGASRVPVQLDRVIAADVAASIELVGSLIAHRRTVVVSEVDGVILEIPTSGRQRIEAEIGGQQISEAPRLDIGVDVAKGDVLVRLDPTEYELKLKAACARLNTARRELEKLRAWRRPQEIQSAEAARDEAAARVVLAESDLQRATSLLADHAAPKADYDRARADLTVAQAALRRAEAELDLAGAGPTKEDVAVAEAAVAQAEAEVDRAEWEADRTTIRAAYDGVVTDRYVDEGDRVTAMPRVEIMELMDLSILTAEFCVAERYINKIRVGDPAEIHVKGTAEPVSGIVTLINDKVDSASRTFRIRVGIGNHSRHFKVGQFVRVALEVAGSPGALTVPDAAITYTGGEAHVFVHDDGRVHQRAVKLGVSNPETAEVLSGLAEGDEVVVDDPSILADGMSVEVKAANPVTQRSVSAT